MSARRSAARFALPVLLAPLACQAVLAQQQGGGTISLTATSFTTPYTQDFNGLLSTSGVANGTAATLPAGWYFIETGSSADSFYSTSPGSANGGDTYSYGPSGNADRALGTLQGSNLVSTIGASVTNNTGAAITRLQIAYVGEQWRAGRTDGTIDRLDFQYRIDATSLTTGTWTNLGALDFLTPNPSASQTGALDGNATGNRTALSGAITGLNIPDGATVWIRWSDFNVGGMDDGLAVDDFSISPAPVPEPAAVLTAAAGGLGLAGLVRRRLRSAVGVEQPGEPRASARG